MRSSGNPPPPTKSLHVDMVDCTKGSPKRTLQQRATSQCSSSVHKAGLWFTFLYLMYETSKCYRQGNIPIKLLFFTLIIQKGPKGTIIECCSCQEENSDVMHLVLIVISFPLLFRVDFLGVPLLSKTIWNRKLIRLKLYCCASTNTCKIVSQVIKQCSVQWLILRILNDTVSTA